MFKHVFLASVVASSARHVTQAAMDSNDLLALNYALTLEHLEATFYQQNQRRFSRADFLAAGYEGYVWDMFGIIAEHETAHVNALVATITSRGGRPVPPCNYTFPVTNVTTYVGVAKVLEATGVLAYDGAINRFSDKGLIQVAATIATVEARHSAFLNQLTGPPPFQGVPFPDSFDGTLMPSEVVTAVTPFIVACPYRIRVPVLLNATSASGSRSTRGGY